MEPDDLQSLLINGLPEDMELPPSAPRTSAASKPTSRAGEFRAGDLVQPRTKLGGPSSRFWTVVGRVRPDR